MVERLLRERFDDDDRLHASQRREAEEVRQQLLAACGHRGHEDSSPKPEIRNWSEPPHVRCYERCGGAASGSTQARPFQRSKCDDVATRHAREEKPGAKAPDAVEISQRFGPNAQFLSSPPTGGKERKLCFADLPTELQRVLRVHLRQPGDVSAVIETPLGFLVYLCQEKTSETLRVAMLSLPKCSYEQWLAEQTP